MGRTAGRFRPIMSIQKTTRRRFLTTSAAFAGTAFGPNLLFGKPEESKKLNVAAVGCAGKGRSDISEIARGKLSGAVGTFAHLPPDRSVPIASKVLASQPAPYFTHARACQALQMADDPAGIYADIKPNLASGGYWLPYVDPDGDQTFEYDASLGLRVAEAGRDPFPTDTFFIDEPNNGIMEKCYGGTVTVADPEPPPVAVEVGSCNSIRKVVCVIEPNIPGAESKYPHSVQH